MCPDCSWCPGCLECPEYFGASHFLLGSKVRKEEGPFSLFVVVYCCCSPEFQQCFTHASKLLASLSGFQVTRKSWRKEIFDLFLAYDLFEMNTVSLREWKVIVDNLMTQDQVTFRDLLARLHSTSTPGVVNIFSSFEQV